MIQPRLPMTVAVLALIHVTKLPAQTPALAPVGNYHAHLVSESTAKMLVVPRLPAVDLPSDMATLVRDYELAIKSGDPQGFAALFTEDGLLGQPTGWVRGRDAIQAAAANETARELRVRAHQVSAGDSVATIAASLSAADPDRDVAKVTFTLRRAADSRWLIASLLRENRPRPTSTSGATFTARDLIEQLDSARIERALVLSTAYWFGSALMPGAEKGLPIAEEYARVKAENDWVASESAKYPARLIPFCSLHPLKSYALDEIERCGSHPGIRGIKLHLANSGVDLRKAEDVEQLKRVFQAANARRLGIVIHMRPRLEPYGRQDAELFIREILPAAPDVPIQIAHLAGWGGYDEATDQAVGAFVDAIAAAIPATTHLSFDITSLVFAGQPAERQRLIADRLRQLGLRRIVYGSDLTEPKRDWADVLRFIPLTRSEFALVAGNVTPLLRVKDTR